MTANCITHHACNCIEEELEALSNRVKELEAEVAALRMKNNAAKESADHIFLCVWCSSGLCVDGLELLFRNTTMYRPAVDEKGKKDFERAFRTAELGEQSR